MEGSNCARINQMDTESSVSSQLNPCLKKAKKFKRPRRKRLRKLQKQRLRKKNAKDWAPFIEGIR